MIIYKLNYEGYYIELDACKTSMVDVSEKILETKVEILNIKHDDVEGFELQQKGIFMIFKNGESHLFESTAHRSNYRIYEYDELISISLSELYELLGRFFEKKDKYQLKCVKHKNVLTMKNGGEPNIEIPFYIADSESVVDAIYNYRMDEIPCLVEPSKINRTIVVDRIGITDILNKNKFKCGVSAVGGWGYYTPMLFIEFDEVMNGIKEIELYMPYDFFEIMGVTELEKERSSFDSLKDRDLLNIHVDTVCKQIDLLKKQYENHLSESNQIL